MLMMAGGGVLPLIKFCMAIRPPNVVCVSAHAAISMAAPGAAALAHSASRMASASFGATTPGAPQLLVPLDGAGWACVEGEELWPERPKAERKLFQSDALKKTGS